MAVTAGVDVGSTAAKAVLFDGRIRSRAVMATGWNPREAGAEVFRQAMAGAGVAEDGVAAVVGTGYGRVSLPFIDRKVTEITCHARGAHYLFPGTRRVLDVGGQDSKVVAVNSDGTVAEFVMNDKCAAGTGRFLQMVTGILDVTLDELGQLALVAAPVEINSMCAVFAESEIIGMLARGVPKEAIAAGTVQGVARRLSSLMGRISLSGEVTFTGGLATNPAICTVISRTLGLAINVPADPQTVGALGAAIIGFDGRA
jgi:predicted CoA-substrate-specific enzyme activase